jgi:hypothetical protein
MAIRDTGDRNHQGQHASRALATKLLRGINSGKPVPFNHGHFRRKKALLAKRMGRAPKPS